MNQLQVKQNLPRVQVEKTLEVSLQQLKDLSVQEKIDSDYNLVGYQVTGTDEDLKKAVQLIDQHSQPLQVQELSGLLAQLYSLTKQRKESQLTLDIAFEAFGSRLEKYPADIVREVLSKWPDQSKWWPSWYELKEEIDWRDKRGKLKQSIEAKLLKQQLKELTNEH